MATWQLVMCAACSILQCVNDVPHNRAFATKNVKEDLEQQELLSSGNNTREKKKKWKEKTMPFDVKLMRSQVSYRAAQELIGI